MWTSSGLSVSFPPARLAFRLLYDHHYDVDMFIASLKDFLN